ncbi:MAG: hypothetical protein ABIG20_01025 [archaeon]
MKEFDVLPCPKCKGYSLEGAKIQVKDGRIRIVHTDCGGRPAVAVTKISKNVLFELKTCLKDFKLSSKKGFEQPGLELWWDIFSAVLNSLSSEVFKEKGEYAEEKAVILIKTIQMAEKYLWSYVDLDPSRIREINQDNYKKFREGMLKQMSELLGESVEIDTDVIRARVKEFADNKFNPESITDWWRSDFRIVRQFILDVKELDMNSAGKSELISYLLIMEMYYGPILAYDEITVQSK